MTCINEQKSSLNIPLTIQSHDYVDLTTIFETIYRSGVVFDSYSTVHPLINVTLIVHHPSGWQFSVYDSFSSKLRFVSRNSTGAIYELRGGILPKQGMTFYLNRVVDETQSSADG